MSTLTAPDYLSWHGQKVHRDCCTNNRQGSSIVLTNKNNLPLDIMSSWNLEFEDRPLQGTNNSYQCCNRIHNSFYSRCTEATNPDLQEYVKNTHTKAVANRLQV